MLRTLVDQLTTGIGWVQRSQTIKLGNETHVIKVNVGCGLTIAPTWINIDRSLNAPVANMPECLHHVAYRIAGAQQFYNQEEYCRILQNNYFVYHSFPLLSHYLQIQLILSTLRIFGNTLIVQQAKNHFKKAYGFSNPADYPDCCSRS